MRCVETELPQLPLFFYFATCIIKAMHARRVRKKIKVGESKG